MKKTVLGGIAAALALTSLAGCGEKTVEEGEKPTYDAKVSTAVADWLVAQAPKGVARNAQYGTDDFGLSADIGIALAEVGGYDEEIATIAAAAMKNKKAYTSPGFGTVTSAGATARPHGAFSRPSSATVATSCPSKSNTATRPRSGRCGCRSRWPTWSTPSRPTTPSSGGSPPGSASTSGPASCSSRCWPSTSGRRFTSG